MAGDPVVNIDPAKIRSLVVIQLYFLGDTLLATPAIRALRLRFPRAHIEVVVKRRSAAVLERNPNVDLCSEYDPPHLIQRPAHAARLRARWRREGVDLAVDLTADRRSARLLGAMRPARAVGFEHAATHIWLEAFVPKECQGEHVARHMLRLAGLVGAAGDEQLEFHCSPEAGGEAEAWARRLGAPLVAIHPGGNRQLRRWRQPRWEELTRELRRRGVRVWALGGAKEKTLLGALEAAGAEVAGKGLSLDQTAARIARCSLFIGNDSGPMHVASAMGTPTLSLFGPSLPETVAPPGPENFSFHVRMPCCPCDQRRCVQPQDFCLDRISVDAVLARAERMLQAGPTAAAPESP